MAGRALRRRGRRTAAARRLRRRPPSCARTASWPRPPPQAPRSHAPVDDGWSPVNDGAPPIGPGLARPAQGHSRGQAAAASDQFEFADEGTRTRGAAPDRIRGTARTLSWRSTGRAWLAPWRAAGPQVAAAIVAGRAPHCRRSTMPAARCASCRRTRCRPGRLRALHLRDRQLPDARQPARLLQRPRLARACRAAKRRLNALQAGEIARQVGVAGRAARCATRSRCSTRTAPCSTPPALWEALLARDWPRLFVTERALWQQARLLVVRPCPAGKAGLAAQGPTAHVWRAPAPIHAKAAATPRSPAQCTPEHLAAKPFVPLPVLGDAGLVGRERELFLL